MMTAALDARYVITPPPAWMPPIDDMLMIDPPPLVAICRAASRVPAITPKHVDRHDAMEVGEVVVEEAAMHLAGDSGVVHHHVEPAEGFDGTCDQRTDLLGVGDVGQPEDRVAAQFGGELFTSVALDVGDHHPRALRHEPLDDPGADAGGAAGDDRDLADQFIDHVDELIGARIA